MSEDEKPAQEQVMPTYRIEINGQKFNAVGHNVTEGMFIVHDEGGEIHFFPMHRISKAVIGAEYREFQRQRALAQQPRVRVPDLTLPQGLKLEK